MRRFMIQALAGAMTLVVVLGCTGSEKQSEETYAPVIDPARFVSSVDNPFFPPTPGVTYVYETPDGSERVETSVTHDARVILGVTCVVVVSEETEKGNLVEKTFDWYAQDVEGNVWYFGEDSREYRDGEVVGTSGSWQAGVDGAMPGIIMKGSPKKGEAYRQEYYKGEAEDMGEVVSLHESASVPYGSFDDALMTRDWSPLEPGSLEHKYYARGVGLILEVEGDDELDRVELVSVTSE